MMSMDIEYAKSILQYQAYLKTQTLVNTLSGKEESPVPKFYMENEEEIAFVEFVPRALFRLCETFLLDQPDDPFNNMTLHIFEETSENFLLDLGGTVHFGLLLDHLDWFDLEERKQWTRRMHGLFDNFQSHICQNHLEFYNHYFETQFYGGNLAYFTDYTEEMQYTFLFVVDYEWCNIEEFGPEFMGTFAKFVKDYYVFYEDLVREILSRKQVKKIA